MTAPISEQLNDPTEVPGGSAGASSTTPPPVEKGSVVRLSVNMNAETAAALREIARLHGVSITEAVRRAVSIASWVEEESSNHNTIQVTDNRTGRVRELVLM